MHHRTDHCGAGHVGDTGSFGYNCSSLPGSSSAAGSGRRVQDSSVPFHLPLPGRSRREGRSGSSGWSHDRRRIMALKAFDWLAHPRSNAGLVRVWLALTIWPALQIEDVGIRIAGKGTRFGPGRAADHRGRVCDRFRAGTGGPRPEAGIWSPCFPASLFAGHVRSSSAGSSPSLSFMDLVQSEGPGSGEGTGLSPGAAYRAASRWRPRSGSYWPPRFYFTRCIDRIFDLHRDLGGWVLEAVEHLAWAESSSASGLATDDQRCVQKEHPRRRVLPLPTGARDRRRAIAEYLQIEGGDCSV